MVAMARASAQSVFRVIIKTSFVTFTNIPIPMLQLSSNDIHEIFYSLYHITFHTGLWGSWYVMAKPIRAPNSSSGVCGQQSVGASPSCDS